MVKIKVTACELNGRKVGRITGLVTLDNDATIQEALDYNYVVGKKDSIKAVVAGVLKAMVDGAIYFKRRVVSHFNASAKNFIVSATASSVSAVRHQFEMWHDEVRSSKAGEKIGTGPQVTIS